MKKVKSKLSTFMQNFIAIGLLMLLTLLLCFTTSPFEKSQPKTIDAVSIIPDSTTMYEWNQDERGWYTYLGNYPQTYVGDELNAQLVSMLKSGALDAAATGTTYISNNRASEMTSYEEKQNKEYGYYFKEVTSGFTYTGEGGSLNSFNVTPLEVYRVYADGRSDELVRGVDMIGTPLSMFSNIICAGDDPSVFIGMCGAESGWIPVTASSPTIFVGQVETQRRGKSQAIPPILPAPMGQE